MCIIAAVELTDRSVEKYNDDRSRNSVLCSPACIVPDFRQCSRCGERGRSDEIARWPRRSSRLIGEYHSGT